MNVNADERQSENSDPKFLFIMGPIKKHHGLIWRRTGLTLILNGGVQAVQGCFEEISNSIDFLKEIRVRIRVDFLPGGFWTLKVDQGYLGMLLQIKS